MPSLSAIPVGSMRVAFLGVAAAMLYFAGRVLLGAIPARIDRPMLRALVTAAAVLAVALVAVAMDRPLVALHLPIAAATAAMTFGVAALILGRERTAGEPTADPSWALLVPAVAILLIGGFGGRLDAIVLGLLITYGASAVAGWSPDERPVAGGPRLSSAAFALLLLIGIAVATVAGVVAMKGLPALETVRRLPSDPLAVVFLISPAIVVPMFFELLPPSRPIGWGASMSALVKFALVNLCFVLPIVAFVQADVGVLRGWAHVAMMAPTATSPSSASTMSVTMPATTRPTTQADVVLPTLTFPSVPPVPLRADLIVLAGASLLLVPMAGGWLRPGRGEALVLVACYLLNLFLVMAFVLT